MSIYQANDYKDYIRQRIEKNSGEKGYRSTLAKHAGCQRSYLAQVLHGPIHLTPDHALGLSTYWGFNDDQSDTFLNLLLRDRAATPLLRKKCQRRLVQLRKKAANLSQRLDVETIPEGIAQAVYYSSWHYAAIHISLAIPQLNSAALIATRLGINEGLVEKTLHELATMGLVRLENGSWRVKNQNFHLPKNAPLTIVNHNHWRQKAIQKLQTMDADGLHYSGIFALSNAAAQQIKQCFVEAIANAHTIVGPSTEEDIVCLNCDFFRL